MRKKNAGFTLAELLIALGILGVISTFAIPKVLEQQNNQKKKAIFRETLAMLHSIQEEGMKTGKLTHNNFRTYFFSKINAVKFCTTDATAEGCWTTTIATGEDNAPGFILHNGVTAAGFNEGGNNYGGGQYANGVAIDWNGPEGANARGNDQLFVTLCFGTAACPTYIQGTGAEGPGSMGPLSALNNNVQLWEWVFSDG